MSSVLRSGASFIVLGSALLLAACGGGKATNNAETTPPTLSLPGNLTVSATSAQGAPVNYTVSATDKVDGTDPVTCTPAAGSTFPIGTTTVSCSSTNKANKTATGGFTVTVTDKTAPVLSLPGNQSATATGSSGAVVTFTATATDIVDGTDPVICTPASGSTFPVGTTTVNCTATDKAGNTANGSFAVTIAAAPSPPVLSLPPAIYTVPATSSTGATVTFNATATDKIDGTDSVTCTPASGSPFPIGATTVNCSATDSGNNTGNGSFTVVVPEFWLSAGYSDACAVIASSGNVYCWGGGGLTSAINYGNLGDGITNNSPHGSNSLTAVEAIDSTSTPIAGAVTSTASEYFTCSVLSAGGVDCWGRNNDDQLGNGTTSPAYLTTAAPVVVASGGASLTGATSVASAGYQGNYACAVINGGANGTVQCWGNGFLGSGSGTSPETSDVPVTVLDGTTGNPLNGVVSVSTSDLSACALISDGTVRCWGENGQGELGTGTYSTSTGLVTPGSNQEAYPVVNADGSNLTGVVQVSTGGAGLYFTCAVISDGTARCWGDDTDGELGDNAIPSGTTQPPKVNPVTVLADASGDPLTGVVSITTAGGAACALISNGTVKCWGDDTWGILGNGVGTDSETAANDSGLPVSVLNVGGAAPLTGAVAVVGNASAFCALISSGSSAVCWGNDAWGELGDGASGLGTTTGSGGYSATPLAVSVLSSLVP